MRKTERERKLKFKFKIKNMYEVVPSLGLFNAK